MKKDITLREFISIKLDKLRKKDKKIELTTDEIIKYKELKKYDITISSRWIVWIFLGHFFIGFWLALASIVFKLGFNLDFTKTLLKIWMIILNNWYTFVGVFAVSFFIWWIIETEINRKFNDKLKLKIIKERKR